MTPEETAVWDMAFEAGTKQGYSAGYDDGFADGFYQGQESALEMVTGDH